MILYAYSFSLCPLPKVPGIMFYPRGFTTAPIIAQGKQHKYAQYRGVHTNSTKIYVRYPSHDIISLSHFMFAWMDIMRVYKILNYHLYGIMMAISAERKLNNRLVCCCCRWYRRRSSSSIVYCAGVTYIRAHAPLPSNNDNFGTIHLAQSAEGGSLNHNTSETTGPTQP